MTVEARWPLAVGLACNLVALALDAWVWLAWQDHGHESTLVRAVIVASNSLLGAFACVEVVRRRRGWRSPLFWGASASQRHRHVPHVGGVASRRPRGLGLEAE